MASTEEQQSNTELERVRNLTPQQIARDFLSAMGLPFSEAEKVLVQFPTVQYGKQIFVAIADADGFGYMLQEED